MSRSNWSRRDLLKWGLGAGVSTAFLESVGHIIHVPGWNRLLTGTSQPFPEWWVKDSFTLTQHLGRMGAASQLATFFQLQEAQAQAQANDWTLITIKVFDQVHHPLVFALGKLNADNTNTTFASVADASHPALNKASGSRNYLSQNGIKDLSDDSRFAALRFNKWFGRMLKHGTHDGVAASTTAGNAGGYESYVGTFPNDVAIQTGIGLLRDTTYPVHNLTLTKIRPELCDVNHLAGYKGLVTSPLGITAFMMGERYDANGGEDENVVYSGFSSNESRRFEVRGRSVSALVQNINQSLAGDFGDYRSLDSASDKNLSYLFDRVAVSDPKRRAALLSSRETVRQLQQTFSNIAGREMQTMSYPASTTVASFGNGQAIFDATPGVNRASLVASKQEFLSQCAFVATALQVEGKPYRNFSLFLNVNDLDGSDIDNPINGIASSFNALNYVEGMRQLAMGLNILAKAIAGKKCLVMVVSDGGRDRDMGDGSGSCFAMLMGPKGEGYLDDALHGPTSLINTESYGTSDLVQNLGSRRTGLEWTTGGETWGLRNNDGTKANNTSAMVGDWQVGVLQFLAEVQGRNVMAPELARYVRFKRFNRS